MSKERQQRILEQQVYEIGLGIDDLKANDGEYFSIKQLEKQQKENRRKIKKIT